MYCAQIADHYDRGNDFFNAFLGPKMIYTSAFYQGLDQTLEHLGIHRRVGLQVLEGRGESRRELGNEHSSTLRECRRAGRRE